VQEPTGRGRRRVAFALLLALGLARCASVRPAAPVAVPISPDRAADLARRWAAEWETFPGLRGAIELTIKTPQGNDRAAAVLLVAPTALRLEIAAPFGLAALVATAGPDEITIYRVYDRRAQRAQPSPAAIGRWLGVALPLPTLIRLLVGSVPTPADPGSIAVENAPSPHLTWSQDGARYRVWVTADGRPARLDLQAANGDRLRAEFTWIAGGGLAQLRVEAPERRAELMVRYISAEPAQSPPEAFRLVLPPDVPVQPLD
jgi:hypothetical protein